MFRWWTVACASVVLLSIATCQDPADPCGRPFACQVTGADLYIPQLEIIAGAQDSVDGLGIIDPGPAEVAFTVRNRGDTISSATRLVLGFGHLPVPENRDPTSLLRLAPDDTLTVPALRPGEEFPKRVIIDTGMTTNTPVSMHDNDPFLVSGTLLLQDADSTNNRQWSAQVHVRIAVLSVELDVPDTAVQVNMPFPAVFTIVNSSRYGTLPAARIGFYLIRYDLPLSDEVGGPLGFGMEDIPPLPPSSTTRLNLDLTIPPGACYDYKSDRYIVSQMIVAPGTSDSMLWAAGAWFRQSPGPIISLHPDYRACDPALLVPDSTVAAVLACANWAPHYVFELVARADREYSIEQTDHPGATMFDDQGERVMNVGLPWFHVEAAGTYWIVDFLPGAQLGSLRTMTLRERPWSPPSSGNRR